MHELKIPYYSGNIKLTKCIGHVDLDTFIRANKNPKPLIKATIEQIRALGPGDKQKKRQLKHKLYSFTPSCFINKNDKRRLDNIIKYNGIMQMDFDDIGDIAKVIELKNWIFNNPSTIAAYISPSQGIKSIMRTTIPEDREHYNRLWLSVFEHFEMTDCCDEATKNPVLPLFISYDPDIKFRPFEATVPWEKEKETQKPIATPQTPTYNNKFSDSFVDKTIRIFTNRIESILDKGHPQVRTACLILGSRVGAGYISEYDAIALAESLIMQNEYLSKGTKGYIETCRWAIKEGSKNPKYY